MLNYESERDLHVRGQLVADTGGEHEILTLWHGGTAGSARGTTGPLGPRHRWHLIEVRRLHDTLIMTDTLISLKALKII